MNYIELIIQYPITDPWYDLIADELASIGFEAFENRDEKLYAYIQKENFDLQTVKLTEILSKLDKEVKLNHREIQQQNWNEEWESNYHPVVIDERVCIRAPFHREEKCDTDIVIQPKMAFGTGHHETTQLMVRLMLDLNLSGKRVLDMGTGTGVLAILAEKLGARDITAVDNDLWAVENSRENVMLNRCKNIDIMQGSTDEISGPFDIILANINTNVLLEHAESYFRQLDRGGRVILSGFLKKDEGNIKKHYVRFGFTCVESNHNKDWCGIIFAKSTA